MDAAESIRIGSGAGYAGDRIEPAVSLSTRPDLDYLGLECLAERTIALARRDRAHDRGTGYNHLLEERMRRILPGCAENGIRVITSMGAAAPEAAADRTRAIADALALDGLAVASVGGSNVIDAADRLADRTFDGEPTEQYVDKAVAADAYLGVDGIVEALDAGADVVITGRVADPSLFLAPMVHEFDWRLDPLDDPETVGQGLAAAHLIECAGQVTGGYHADPGRADVPDLADLAFPIAEVTAAGEVTITKDDGGGCVTPLTCTEQLLYEVDDPAAYLTPDGVADFSEVHLESVGPDRVRVTGATARPRPDTLKVSLGYEAGVLGVGEISYAGPNATARARLAGDVVHERLDRCDVPYDDLRVDLVGVDALHGPIGRAHGSEPYEVRLRVAARCPDEDSATRVSREVQTLYTNGPAGGGGVTMRTEPQIGIVSTVIDRATTRPVVEVGVAGEAIEPTPTEAADPAVGEVADAR